MLQEEHECCAVQRKADKTSNTDDDDDGGDRLLMLEMKDPKSPKQVLIINNVFTQWAPYSTSKDL